MTSPVSPGLTSAVVVTWNGAEILAPCLESLLAQQGLAKPLEVIVVDNGSTDGTLALLADRFPTVVVVTLDTNTGFTGGANAGIAAARGDVVALLNNDAVADARFATNARAVLESHPEVAAVTGLILLDGTWAPAETTSTGALVAFDGSRWARRDGGRTLVNSTGGEITASANGRDRDWLVAESELARQSGVASAFSGGAVALRRSALDAVGTFDESLFMYYEDSDLSWRLRRAGWQVRFERAAVVVHQHAASSGTESEFFLFHNERNRLLFALKHAPWRVVVAAFARTVFGAVRAAARRDWASAGRKLRASGAAVALSARMVGDRRNIDRSATVDRRELWSSVPRD